VKTLSRSQNRNAVLAACYRAGVRLIDACDFFTKDRRIHDYSRRNGVVASGVILPDHAPASFADRQILWNEQERAENRKNSRVAREVIIALPHELNEKQRQGVVIKYAEHIKTRYAVACDYAVHSPDKDADERNHHAHILFTTRKITAQGFAEKTRELDDKIQGVEEIKHLRQTWENQCNDALADAEITARISCQSLEAQGIHRLPEPKQGKQATALQRQGKPSHAVAERQGVKAYNRAVRLCSGQERTVQLKHDKAVLRRIRRRKKNVAQWLFAKAVEIIKASHRKQGLWRAWQMSQHHINDQMNGANDYVETGRETPVFTGYQLE
jgi:hypothetical protein